MLHQFTNLPTSYLLMSFGFAIFSGFVGFFIGQFRGIQMCQSLLKKAVDANVLLALKEDAARRAARPPTPPITRPQEGADVRLRLLGRLPALRWQTLRVVCCGPLRRRGRTTNPLGGSPIRPVKRGRSGNRCPARPDAPGCLEHRLRLLRASLIAWMRHRQ